MSFWDNNLTPANLGLGVDASLSGTGPISIVAGVITLAVASESVPGSMSAADKIKLDGWKGASSVSFAIVAGATNVALVTIQIKDASGTNLTSGQVLDIYLSDASTGAGLTGTSASGAVAAGASGTDLFDWTAKKHKRVLTDNTGKYILSITDSAKTTFYVAAVSLALGTITVSSQLSSGSYGS